MRLYTSELVKKYKSRTVVNHVSIDVNPLDFGFSLKKSYDFKGYSHDKITKEVYEI